jgi:hypothetical protein
LRASFIGGRGAKGLCVDSIPTMEGGGKLKRGCATSWGWTSFPFTNTGVIGSTRALLLAGVCGEVLKMAVATSCGCSISHTSTLAVLFDVAAWIHAGAGPPRLPEFLCLHRIRLRFPILMCCARA